MTVDSTKEHILKSINELLVSLATTKINKEQKYTSEAVYSLAGAYMILGDAARTST